jgi:hypothetical protein
MAIDGTVSGQFTANDRRTVGLSPTLGVNIGVNVAPSTTFADGVGAGQANVLYQFGGTFSGTTASIDLNGVLTDSYGTTVALLRVKALYIENTSTTNNIVVGNGTNPWATLLGATHTLTLRPLSWFIVSTGDATGWAVTAATGDILLLTGTSGQPYKIAILGGNA